MFCRNCGKALPDDSAFCDGCGRPTDLPAPAPHAYAGPGHGHPGYHPHAKSRIAAGLLGIFLGSFGIHRFYLGFHGVGVLQLILTFVTFGVAGIWGFIEGIVILAGGFPADANGVPLRD